MQDKNEWFFSQIRTHVVGFEKKLLEEINALQQSIDEHTEGLRVLEEAKACDHIRSQFAIIIERHTKDRDERTRTLEGARESFNKVLSLEGCKKINIDTFVDVLAAILQLEYKEEPKESEEA